MKAFTDKLDFYKGKYKEQKIKNICSIEGEDESFLDLLNIFYTSKDRYTAAIGCSLLLSTKEVIAYTSLCICLSNESKEEIVNTCFRAMKFKPGHLISRVLSYGLPDKIDLIEKLSSRYIEKHISISINQSISDYLSQFMDKKDASIISDIAFYDDRALLLKIIGKQRGWSNESLNNVSVLYTHRR